MFYLSADPAERRWRPRGRTEWRQSQKLTAGMIVVWERAAHRVTEVRERPDELWGEQYEAAWAKYGRGERATWSHRPVVVVLQPDGRPKAKPQHLCGPANHLWDVLAEHYAVCHVCRELPPCRHEIAEAHVEFHMKRATELMAIPRGHCLGCGSFVTRRMEAHRFPGPNLWRPDLGDNSAVFHARQSCSDAVHAYREQWEATRTPADSQLAIDDEA